MHVRSNDQHLFPCARGNDRTGGPVKSVKPCAMVSPNTIWKMIAANGATMDSLLNNISFSCNSSGLNSNLEKAGLRQDAAKEAAGTSVARAKQMKHAYIRTQVGHLNRITSAHDSRPHSHSGEPTEELNVSRPERFAT